MPYQHRIPSIRSIQTCRFSGHLLHYSIPHPLILNPQPLQCSNRKDLRFLAPDGTHAHQTPEGELWLHDDRLLSIQTANRDYIIAFYPQHCGRVAVLVDPVRMGGGWICSPRVRGDVLLSVDALDSCVVVDENAERPTLSRVVVYDLRRIGNSEHFSLPKTQW